MTSTTGWRERWPRLIVDCDTEEAARVHERYFAVHANGSPKYTGSRFEAIAGWTNSPNAFTPADLLAVSMLSVDTPAPATIRLLERDAALASELLEQIPADADIVDVTSDVLASGSMASQLWDLLRDGSDGLGRTRTSKLLACKRPRLLPIWDSFVEIATGLDTRDYWRHFQTVLLADDRRIWEWLGEVQSNASSPDSLARLRVLDILLWMSVHEVRQGSPVAGVSGPDRP